MRKFNFKAYLEKKQKLDYVISKEEYVTGQTWCILKKQHVCLYFFALFFAGILLELYHLAGKNRVSNAFLLSVFAVAMFLLILWKIRRTAGIIYETEPHAFCVIYEKKGFLMTNTDTAESVFYGWNMVQGQKRIGKIGIVFLSQNVYFFLPVESVASL